jgi:IS30 family transposase
MACLADTALVYSFVMPGHWEGDFIKGAGNKSSVGVAVGRTSRLVLLAKMEDATAAWQHTPQGSTP